MGIESTNFPYGVWVAVAFFRARYWADLSKVWGKPSAFTVPSKWAMPDLLTNEARPNDMSSKLRSSELFSLFLGGCSIETSKNGTTNLAKALHFEPHAWLQSADVKNLARHGHGERHCPLSPSHGERQHPLVVDLLHSQARILCELRLLHVACARQMRGA